MNNPLIQSEHLMSYPYVEGATHEIYILWRSGDTITLWNEHMAWITEEFGLPGEEWSADVKTDGMRIRFKDPKAATLCRLKFGL
jgi:hypothetical protein